MNHWLLFQPFNLRHRVYCIANYSLVVQSANPFHVKDQHRPFTTRFALLPFHDSPLNFEVTSNFKILSVRIFSARNHSSTRAGSYASSSMREENPPVGGMLRREINGKW